MSVTYNGGDKIRVRVPGTDATVVGKVEAGGFGRVTIAWRDDDDGGRCSLRVPEDYVVEVVSERRGSHPDSFDSREHLRSAECDSNE